MDYSEDWCFVCKEGGQLVLCDYKGCLKAYHAGCLDNKEVTTDPWICKWHSCNVCRREACFHCLTCPRAVCKECFPGVLFINVKGEQGFCFDCLERVNTIEENQNANSDKETLDLTTSKGLFKDYYVKEIKERYGLTLQKIHDAKKRAKGKFQFAAIIAENRKLVYLRKSLLQELEKDPEIFEDKVRGGYVLVRREPNTSPELLPITVVRRSHRRIGRMTFSVSTLSRNLSVDSNSLSDSSLSEADCAVLMQKIKDGLIPKPTVTELQMKVARGHNEWIAKKRLLLERRITQAREKNLGPEELEKLLKIQKVQHDSSWASGLIRKYKTVKGEKQNVQGNEGLPESVSQKRKRGDKGNLASGSKASMDPPANEQGGSSKGGHSKNHLCSKEVKVPAAETSSGGKRKRCPQNQENGRVCLERLRVDELQEKLAAAEARAEKAENELKALLKHYNPRPCY